MDFLRKDPRAVGFIFNCKMDQRSVTNFLEETIMKSRGMGQGRLIFVLALISVATACNSEAEFQGQSADKKNPVVISDQEYPAALIADGTAQFRPAFGLVDESLVLQEKPAVRTDLRQIERAVGMDSFKQGHDGSLTSEDFDVSKERKLDLLVVVDDSRSMADEQVNLATKLSALTKHLTSTDWQVGVITTTSCALRNGGRPIKKSDATADADFVRAVNVGINGDGNERGILRAYQLINGTGTCNNRWLRSDAALAILFVSDEESYCTTRDCPRGSEPADLETLLKRIRPAELLRAYALIWDNADPLCRVIDGESKGTRYIDIANRLNGLSSSICAADYTNTLEQISLDASRIVKHEFDLKYNPAAGNIVMTLDGMPYTDFDVTGKKVKLNTVPDTALKLQVSYRYDTKPKFDKVKVSGPLDPDTLQVFVGKNELPVDKFQWDEVEKEIFFVDMPEDNAEVKVKYRKNNSLLTKFDLSGKNVEEKFEMVQVDGKPVANFSVDPVTMVLVFDSPPKDGARISVFSRSAHPEITHYKVPNTVAVESVLAVSAYDPATSEQIAVKMEGRELVFNAEQVVADRKVMITYDYGDKDTVLNHELSEEPLEGTVAVEVVSGDEGCINSVTLSGKSLQYQCSGDELQEIKVTYKYVAKRYSEFPVATALDRDNFVTVWIDGARTFEFVLNGNTVLVPESLTTIDSTVRVIVTVLQ